MFHVQPSSRKLRKPSHSPPSSYRPLDLNAYIPSNASSSAIARATASMNSLRTHGHVSYTSTSLPRPRKLSKSRPHFSSFKSISLGRSFNSKSTSTMQLYSDPFLLLPSPKPLPSPQPVLRPPTPPPPISSQPSHLHSLIENPTDNPLASTPTSPPTSPVRKRTGANLMRRWSLLEIPDEVLALEFEEMRRVTKLKERKSSKAKSENHTPLDRNGYTPGAFVYGGPPPSEHRFWLGVNDDDDDDSDDDHKSDAERDPDSDLNATEGRELEERGWKITRRALFCCRELIRTEKTYFTRLVQLLDGKTLTPPPTLLVTYLPALIVASNTLIDKFSQDPTAYGISKGFVDTELLLENALVAYCGVVGDVFTSKRSEKRKLVRSTRTDSMLDTGRVRHTRRSSPLVIPRRLSDDTPPPPDKQELPSSDNEKSRLTGGLKRTMTLFKRKSLPPLTSVGMHRMSHSGPPSPKRSRTLSIFSLTPIVSRGSLMSLGLGKNGSSLVTPSSRPHAKSDPVPPVQFPVSRVSSIGRPSVYEREPPSSLGHDDRNREKIPTARDLAILPTQRATRFVLLFRDLFNHTPENSPSRPLVERALQGAIRIAEKCDRAQGNAAFLRAT